eukprot:c8644_g1_i1.p1 GENE.c8644_g1_i1~~c8644_g1_i1.p1  ORF type:complete len:173 (-),score=39.40 c8644_g1_i1:39-515(-)
MEFSSKALYQSRLTAHESVATHTLRGIVVREPTPDSSTGLADILEYPLLLIDTAGCDMRESTDVQSDSKANVGEAGVVCGYVTRLVKSGVDAEDIGVITPYNAQAQLIRESLRALYPALEVKSVDGFQGREKEVIVISCVRSNTAGNIGFLSDKFRFT